MMQGVYYASAKKQIGVENGVRKYTTISHGIFETKKAAEAFLEGAAAILKKTEPRIFHSYDVSFVRFNSEIKG